MIELTKDDDKTLKRLGYRIEQDVTKVSSDWDSADLLGPNSSGEYTRIGAVTRRAGGGFLCSMTFRVWEVSAKEGPHSVKRTSTGRAYTAGSAVQAAHDDRERQVSNGIREREVWQQDHARRGS